MPNFKRPFYLKGEFYLGLAKGGIETNLIRAVCGSYIFPVLKGNGAVIFKCISCFKNFWKSCFTFNVKG